MAIIAGPAKRDSGKMGAADVDAPNDGQKAAADRLAAILGVDDADELASALKDFYDNC